MPTRPPRACQVPRCPGLAVDRYCAAHAERGAQQERARDRKRGTARERGYNSAWEKARVGFLAKHPRCECPAHKGRPDAPMADTVDHHIPHRLGEVSFWDSSNWVAMTASCHSTKTGRFDRPGSKAVRRA